MSVSYDLRISPRPGPLPGRVDSEKGQLQSFVHESPPSSNTISNTRRGICAAWSNIKMPSFRQFVFTFLIAAFLTSAYARRPIHLRRPDVALSGPGDESAFRELLSQVSDSSLHEVLHDVSDKYKHGVYPEDRTALQEIHKDNPAMATSLVKLARRQNNTVTTVEPVTSTDTVVVVPPESTSTVIVPVSPTDTTGQTATAQNPPSSQPSTQVSPNSPVPSSSALASVSVPLPPGSTAAPPQSSQANPSSSQGSTPPKTTGPDTGTGTGKGAGTSATGGSSPGAASTNSANSNPVSTSAGESSTGKTSGPVTAQTSTTQQIVFTTTLPNGSRSTVTSFTIVPAGEQAATPGTSASATGTPSLQNGAIEKGNPSSMRAMGAFLAALAFIMGVL